MSSKTRGAARIVSILVMIGGLAMMIIGIVAWSIVSSELASQKINVAAEGTSTHYANSPFDALSQINLIKEHTATQMSSPASEGGFGFPEGTTYAEVPRPDAQLLTQCRNTQTAAAVAGETPTLSDECKQAMTNDAARTYLDNSNFKQASLYTSVLAFGVAALVIGLGLALILIGWVELVRIQDRKAVAAPVREDELVGAAS